MQQSSKPKETPGLWVNPMTTSDSLQEYLDFARTDIENDEQIIAFS